MISPDQKAASIIETYEGMGVLRPEHRSKEFRARMAGEISKLVRATEGIQIDVYVPFSRFGTVEFADVVRAYDPSIGSNLHGSQTFVFSDTWGGQRDSDLLPRSKSLVYGLVGGGAADGERAFDQLPEMYSGLNVAPIDPAAFISVSAIRRHEGREPLRGFIQFPELSTVDVETVTPDIRAIHEVHRYRPYAAVNERSMILGRVDVNSTANPQTWTPVVVSLGQSAEA